MTSVQLEGGNQPTPKVSVVMPVYNTARYLRQCLDSVLAQTLDDIEVICVDDGSNDGSLEIVSEYAQVDERVRLFTQQNCYAGVARNVGIEHARGDYLVFWDSDDYFHCEALSKMYEQCERYSADICVCGASRYLEERGVEEPNPKYLAEDRLPDSPVFNRESNPNHILTFTTVMLWNKMYSREFVKAAGLRFQARRNANDVYFSACALLLARRIVTVRECLVTYRVGRDDSLVSTLDKSPTATIDAWADVRASYGEEPWFPEWSYFYKVVSVLRHTSRQLHTPEARKNYRRALRTGALKRLGITGRSFSTYLDRGRCLLAALVW